MAVQDRVKHPPRQTWKTTDQEQQDKIAKRVKLTEGVTRIKTINAEPLTGQALADQINQDSPPQQTDPVIGFPTTKQQIDPLIGFPTIKQQASSSLTCSSCEGLRIRCIRGQAPCSKSGRSDQDKICSFFTPLPPQAFNLPHKSGADFMMELSDLIAMVPSTNLDGLIGVLLMESRTRKMGFRFFQKMYYRWKGDSTDDYLSNFVIGYVLYAFPTRVVLITRDASSTMTLYMDEGDTSILEGSLYTENQFSRLRPLMKGKIDHETNRKLRRKPDDATTALSDTKHKVVISIDELLDTQPMGENGGVPYQAEPGTAKVRNKVRDLVAITSDLTGYVGKVDASYYSSSEPEVEDGGLSEYTNENDADNEDLSD